MVRKYHAQIESGQGVVGRYVQGQVDSLSHFMNIDDLAVYF